MPRAHRPAAKLKSQPKKIKLKPSQTKNVCRFACLKSGSKECQLLIEKVEQVLSLYDRLKTGTATNKELLAEIDPLVKRTNQLKKGFLALSDLSLLLLDKAGGVPSGLAEIDAAFGAIQSRLDATRTDLKKPPSIPRTRRHKSALNSIAPLLGNVFDHHADKAAAACKNKRKEFIVEALLAAEIPFSDPDENPSRFPKS
jgi:hypothetical protein